jgi:hypothetical protein
VAINHKVGGLSPPSLFLAPCEFRFELDHHELGPNKQGLRKVDSSWLHFVFCQGHHFFESNAGPISFGCWHAMSTLGQISNFKLMLLSNIHLFLKCIWTNEYFYNIWGIFCSMWIWFGLDHIELGPNKQGLRKVDPSWLCCVFFAKDIIFWVKCRFNLFLGVAMPCQL